MRRVEAPEFGAISSPGSLVFAATDAVLDLELYKQPSESFSLLVQTFYHGLHGSHGCRRSNSGPRQFEFIIRVIRVIRGQSVQNLEFEFELIEKHPAPPDTRASRGEHLE